MPLPPNIGPETDRPDLDRAVLDLRALAASGRQALMSPTERSRLLGRTLFDDLFVLELANNHWGSLARGLKIIDDFAAVVRRNGVKAAIKLQFRDVDTFIHRDFRAATDIRYVKKTADTRLPWSELRQLVEAVRAAGLVTMVTPFDEISVGKCVEFGVEILKIASSDIRDTRLVGAMLATGKPAIMSTGGSSLEDVDALVALYAGRNIPLAINHCVSIYPSEDGELELNQIDFLRTRYPDNVIGFSTHEYTDWATSVAIAYGKGARTFERHIDIDQDGIPVSAYCTLPEQADLWFRAFARAQRMCGGSAKAKRQPPEKETRYLDALVRGVYARRPIRAGELLGDDDIYLAIPLQQGQMSCRELGGGALALQDMSPDAPVMFDDVDIETARSEEIGSLIRARGIAC